MASSNSAAGSPAEEQSALTSSTARFERSKLRRTLLRFDLIYYLICTLVGIDIYGTVAAGGAEAFIWIAVIALLFFVPFSLLISELGSAYPDEGGPYVWVKLAFGRRVAAVNTVIYWLSNPIWLGGLLTIIAIASFETFFAPMNQPQKYLFAFLFIWLSVIAMIFDFRIGKWIPAVGAFARVALMGLFSISAAIYGLSHGFQFPNITAFTPTWAGFTSLVPVLLFAFVGFEVPSAAGDEMVNPQKDVPAAIRRVVGAVLVLYCVPVLLILLVLGGTPLSGLDGLIQACQKVFTVYGGTVAADGAVTLTGFGLVISWFAGVCIIYALFTSGTAWMMGANRTLATAGFDGSAPKWIGHISKRNGTPTTTNILSGVVATITMIAAFALTGGNNQKYFDALLGVVLLFTILSYLVIFPAAWRLRDLDPDRPRPFRVPFGEAGLLICVSLAVLFVVYASISSLLPGLLSNGHLLDDSALPEGISRIGYLMIAFVPVALAVMTGLIFYTLGQREQGGGESNR
jgi:glutamate:GABA antiporter